MTVNLEKLTKLEKQCITKIIDLLYGKNYISANFGAISDSFYTIEYRDQYGDTVPASIGRPGYGISETRTSDFPMPLLNRTVNKLVEYGFLKIQYRNDDEYFMFSDDFVDEAYRIYLDDSKFSDTNFLSEAEDKWEPLTLDRSSETALAAIDATETLVEAVRGDNGFASNEPDVHESIVWSLRAGLDVIKNHSPTREQIKVLLKKPIQLLMTKFSGALLGDLAEKAATAISHWLGLLF